MKRFAALIIMLVLAGQVLAGVCECLSGDDGHSCCEKSQELTLKRPPCCTDGDCMSTSDPRQSASHFFSIRLFDDEQAIPSHSTDLTAFHWDTYPENVLLESFEGESPPLPVRNLFITHLEILL